MDDVSPDVPRTHYSLGNRFLTLNCGRVGLNTILGGGGLSHALWHVEQHPGLHPAGARSTPSPTDMATKSAPRPCEMVPRQDYSKTK